MLGHPGLAVEVRPRRDRRTWANSGELDGITVDRLGRDAVTSACRTTTTYRRTIP